MLKPLLDIEKPIAELDSLIEELKRSAANDERRKAAEHDNFDIESEIARVESRRQQVMREVFANLTPWNRVQMARHPMRPYTLDYINAISTNFVELHGDRINADDPAIVGGFCQLNGRTVMAIGHQKGRDLKERQHRNFGSARPAGFRKALRLMQLAARFRKPIVTFIDTPAAEANLMAEEEGISRAIAYNIQQMFHLPVPIVVAVIGEGGSGGALGIAVGDRVIMLEHSIYSVIPPESCAAILSEFGRDRARASEAAAALKLTAQHAKQFHIADYIVEEPLGGAHRDPGAAGKALAAAISAQLDELRTIPPTTLLQMRYDRYRSIGSWEEIEAAAVVTPIEPEHVEGPIL